METYPATCRPEDALQALQDEQYGNWFYTDVMVRGEYPQYMERYFDMFDIHINMDIKDSEILKSGLVDFLSFHKFQRVIRLGKKQLEI